MRTRKSSPKPTPSAPDEWLRLDRQLCFALYASSLAMTKQYKPLLAALGLTYPQYLVMLLLWEQDGVSVSSLGQRLSLDSGTLTPLLKRLEANALISRRRAADDERRVDIFLSAAGQALREEARKIPPQIACATACSMEEIHSLTQRLHQLREQLSLTTDLPTNP
ncbi:MarR family winged helix-turn-helix transcriptional regulator [Roseateles oligotrophus]|uniref:MarR family transcriptional regulator n=1 Tax=Roseateles oligotrophus TaxID=1769250 RepID=A0ABT2YFG2_9BURK|nr:MarR family transcriptional regulator [Roseateles oligotrophus]MCV2368779.1 MarR family transcriptional regulator [Roseateles oligotrophus]